jgi:nitroimidazol reductase NimA-like FMN-containing flavoprotein (pyridoxamine 5'-phosphate oxidase superfamily)
MTEDECWAFLRSSCLGTLSTIDQDGFPHVVSTGYVVGDGTVRLTSYKKAQKVINLRRNPRAGLLVEVTAPYAAIRGVMIRGDIEVRDDPDAAHEVMLGIAAQNERLTPDTWALQPPVPYWESSRKRVEMILRPVKIVSWDHARLAGRY